jgi:hypothetical protein
MGWCQDVCVVFSPHLTAHDRSGVTTISDSNPGGVIDQPGYLLAVTFVGRSKVNGSQLASDIAGCMQLESVMPALPILPEGSDTFGDSVSVGSNELANREHGRVNKSEWRVFDKELVQDAEHAR